jgi:ABC-type transporter Mla MlaB component
MKAVMRKVLEGEEIFVHVLHVLNGIVLNVEHRMMNATDLVLSVEVVEELPLLLQQHLISVEQRDWVAVNVQCMARVMTSQVPILTVLMRMMRGEGEVVIRVVMKSNKKLSTLGVEEEELH